MLDELGWSSWDVGFRSGRAQFLSAFVLRKEALIPEHIKFPSPSPLAACRAVRPPMPVRRGSAAASEALVYCQYTCIQCQEPMHTKQSGWRKVKTALPCALTLAILLLCPVYPTLTPKKESRVNICSSIIWRSLLNDVPQYR